MWINGTKKKRLETTTEILKKKQNPKPSTRPAGRRVATSVRFSIQNYKIAIINDYKRFLYTLLEIDKRLLTIL